MIAINNFLRPWYLVLFIFWGAAIGSFLNVIIYRLPRGFLLAKPKRSVCLSCFKKIPWYENIPIVGYLFLMGRCASCKQPIGFRYFIVECLGALLFCALYLNFGLTHLVLYYGYLTMSLLAIAFIDLEHHIIPDAITYPGIILGFLGSMLVMEHSFISSLIGFLLGGGMFWFMAWLYYKFTGREGLGFGDVKLLAMIGAFLGPFGVIATILISSVLGTLIGVTLMVVRRANLKLAIPYGPFLTIGALAVVFWGKQIFSFILFQQSS